ncbi:SNF2 family N-terminal domain-containing protein [Trametes maxima]|nr:SNF2 family N-terminal domain-containing protein [Trametes maxima]
MSSRRKSVHQTTVAARSSSRDAKKKPTPGLKSLNVAPIEDVRAKLVQDRREELDKVFDTHDTLVREAFHLEKFVSMLTYDPEAAKQDRSDVFQRFQAQYDLVDHTASAGASRRTTRRAHTERLQTLQVHAPPSPSTPLTRKPRKSEQTPKVAFWDIKAEAKSKGKLADLQSSTSHSSTHNGKGRGNRVVVEIPLRSVHQAKAAMNGRHAPLTGDDHEPEAADPAPANGLAPPPPRKKRRIGPSGSAVEGSSRSSARLRSATTLLDFSRPGPGDSVSFSSSRLMNEASSGFPDVPPSPAKLTTPRVKLIVRKPPPVYTHPSQRPKPPTFGGSIEALFDTFTYRFDDEVTPEQLGQELKEEFQVWRRVDELRREGRMIGERSSFEFQPSNSKDVWSYIVHEIETRGTSLLINSRRGASSVASKVRAHWSGESDRERKRLRTLARTTLEAVMEEWKKAVYHLREQERLTREEEERRLGQEHLDAILNQSGHILEVQLNDLAKESDRDSRSRSRSVSTPAGDWHAKLDDGSSDGTPVSEDERAADESEDSDTSVADEGITMLLPEDVRAGISSRSSRSASVDPGTTSSILDDTNGIDESDDRVEGALHREFSTSGDDPLLEEYEHANSSPSPSVPSTNGRVQPPRPANGASKAPRLVYAVKSDTAMDWEQIDDALSATSVLDPSSPSVQTLPHDLGAEFDDISGSPIVAKTPVLSRRYTLTPPLEDSMIAETPLFDASVLPGCDYSEPATPLPIRREKTSLDITIPEQTDEDATLATPNTPITPAIDDMQEDNLDDEVDEDSSIPYYLRPYAVAPVEWDPQAKVKPPLLLRGTLRPYQQAGLEWLASIHSRNLNGILADEMGLGKTIQTIALLAHLACDRGIWGPHLIIVPTSVLLNWEMEFKKFMPGFKVLSYHGNTKQRKELRQGWNNKYHFNVCITSYTLASRDAHVFKRKRWYYMILDEAHMIKNFKSQRWNILLLFRSFRRLLLTGTPLQNNLTELWALLQFLMSGTDFANLKEFGEWFANPLEKAIELGAIDNEIQQRVSKLHTVLRPYLLRRLKRDVEKELPQKYEHLVMCPLSKRQRFLYDEFMARAQTRHDLQSGVYQKIANILMQLRKVVNHPDLFEVRPIVTSFAMQRSAIADFEVKELLIRRRLLAESDEDHLNLGLLGLRFLDHLGESDIAARETRRLDGTAYLPMVSEVPGEPPPADTRTIVGYRKFRAYQQRAAMIARWAQVAYLNRLRTSQSPVYGTETLAVVRRLYQPLLPADIPTRTEKYLLTPEKARSLVKSYVARAEEVRPLIESFAFVTPAVVARDLPSIALSGVAPETIGSASRPDFDVTLHCAAVKLQIAFPDPSLLQYDCGKLQMLANLLRERKAGGHRVLIFTQMTRILDILETFLNFHGYLYLRLDGATKIEDRQYITERFNSDSRIFCFISSSRSGGVGINLTGADTVIFYDSDFNPQMDRQCEDRAHRIGQIRDVHIYRFISQHTVEEALLRKANQKRSLDDLVIQKGEFDWRTLFADGPEGALTRALGEFEDAEDAQAAQIAAREEMQLESEDARDFEVEGGAEARRSRVEEVKRHEPEVNGTTLGSVSEESHKEPAIHRSEELAQEDIAQEGEDVGGNEEDEDGRTVIDYMLDFVRLDWEHFESWNV